LPVRRLVSTVYSRNMTYRFNDNIAVVAALVCHNVSSTCELRV
jgi:hypothetical protein